MGTDEWLRFSELAGLEPVIGVGFGRITPEEAADWVEYCNGAVTTPMGALRAANGHPEPYGVIYWGIGNEVYGSYQIGHTDARTYAEGFLRMAEAMKQRDPSIQVAAVGLGVHNDYRKQSPDWNQQVLGIAGPAIDLLDVHYYVYGPDREWLGMDGPVPIRRALLASGARLEAYYDFQRVLLSQNPHIGLVHYEWAVLPRVRELGASRQTFFNA